MKHEQKPTHIRCWHFKDKDEYTCIKCLQEAIEHAKSQTAQAILNEVDVALSEGTEEDYEKIKRKWLKSK